MKNRMFSGVAAALMVFGLAQTSEAVLNAVDQGPYLTTYGNYPVWYQDTNGRGLELCLGQSLCLPPVLPDPAAPMTFPDNWPDELFWFTADAAIVDQAQGIDLTYVSGVEAAFGGAGGVVAGEQISFARIRIRADVPEPGTYIVTHPYGVNIFEVEQAGTKSINFTEDIGIGGGGDFTGALKGAIGPFLVRVDENGNPSLITAADGIFVGDPGVTQRVTGSPFGTNFVRIQGPNGLDVATDQFAVSGKVYEEALLSPLVVDRTTYSRTAAQTQVDVFATSAPTATVSFTPPTPAIDMGPGDAAGRFFGQSIVELNEVPPNVDLTAENTALNNLPVIKPDNPVTDVVTIASVTYNAGALTIEASSSDEIFLPTLSFGSQVLTPVGAGPTQSVTVLGLDIPPATVTVTSTAGGSDTEDVVVLP